MFPLDFFTQSIYRQFAGGVGRAVLHGYSSIGGSEADTAWPGHEGMGIGVSERYGPRQPAWGQFGQWANMIGRFQTILNEGAPRIDLGILRTETLGRPYNINCWTGEIEALSSYEYKDNMTCFDLTLKPGEATVIALDKTDTSKQITVISSDAARVRPDSGGFTVIAENSGIYTTILSDGNTYTNQFTVQADIALPTWNLVVEDWNEGEKMVNEENRGLGYITREVYFTTKKTPIAVGETTLIPWKDIPSVGPDVSGVGYYTTTFELPDR